VPRRVVEDVRHRLGKGGRVLGVVEHHPAVVGKQGGRPHGGGGHHREAGGQGFQQHEGERLVAGRAHAQVGRPHEGGHVVPEAQEVDALGEVQGAGLCRVRAAVPCAHHGQVEVRHGREGAQDRVEVFPRGLQVAHEQGQGGVFGQPEGGPRRRAGLEF